MSEIGTAARGELDRAPVATVGPVASGERVVALDTLRGVAVLGILVMNVYAFAMPLAAYGNPLIMGGVEWYNLGTWFVTHLLFDQKFMTLFSMLFGGGLIMMADRAEARGVAIAGIYFRRQAWLLLLGATHAYLIWFGDILFQYALVGMLVYPLRRHSPRVLIVLACLLLPVALLFAHAAAQFMEEQQQVVVGYEQRLADGEELTAEETASLEQAKEIRSFIAPSAEDIQRDLDAYAGSYGDIFEHRAPTVASMQLQSTLAFVVWRVGGLMLLGMAFMRLGILSGRRSPEFYRRLLLVGYAFGLPLTAYSGWDLYRHQFDGLYLFRVGMVPNYIGSIFVAFGHMALVMLIVKSGVLPGLMQRFAAVGRMALTNYLMHSLILTTIFYGYGLGLYGTIPRLWQMAFVAGVIGFQLWVSPVWLGRYRFGPVEWGWRSLSYRRLQPFSY